MISIDFGISNIGSITNALNYLKIKTKQLLLIKKLLKQKLLFQEMVILEEELIDKEKIFDTLNERIK